MNRLGLKIGCLVASMVIWVQVASTSSVQQDILMPLRITGLASGLTYAGSEIPGKVPVRVVGSKLRLLRHKFFNHFVGEVRVDVSRLGPGPVFPYEIKSSDVFTNLTAATVYPPTTLKLAIDRLDSLRLPVRLTLNHALPSDRGLLVPVRVEPDSVLVTGPHRAFDPVPLIATEGLDLGKISESMAKEVRLDVPRPLLNIRPERVRVEIKVSPLQERTLANVPVIALVDAGRPEVVVSPPMADLKVRGVADSVQTLTRDDLLVTITVGDRPEGIYSLPGQVDHPSWMTLMGIVPPQFRVIVGNPPLQEPAAQETEVPEGEGE